MSKKILEKLYSIAVKQQKIISKLAEAPQVSQAGTTELFFSDESKQRAFASAIQQENGLVYKVLLSAFNKTGGNAPVSFDLKIEATPQGGAKWILTTNPEAIKAAVVNALNTEYLKIMGVSMPMRLKDAAAKAKAGSGSGILDIGKLELNP